MAVLGKAAVSYERGAPVRSMSPLARPYVQHRAMYVYIYIYMTLCPARLLRKRITTRGSETSFSIYGVRTLLMYVWFQYVLSRTLLPAPQLRKRNQIWLSVQRKLLHEFCTITGMPNFVVNLVGMICQFHLFIFFASVLGDI